MKILVTGAAGFIGSHAVERFLLEGHSVYGIDNLRVGNIKNLMSVRENVKFTFSNKDIRLKSDLDELPQDFDLIIHLAAMADIVPSITNPQEYYEVNVTGTFNIMEFGRNIKAKKIIYVASSSCYGIPNSYPTPETSKIDCRYPYALTKYLGECIALHWGEIFNIPVTSLRLFNVYGPRARTSGTYGAVFGVFLAQKIANKPFTVVGDGSQTRDFTFVSDVVEAIVCASQSDKSGIYNVGSGKTYSVNKLVELLQGDVTYIPKRPGEPDCTFADTSKITRDLGWKPNVTLESGVREMLTDLSHWKDAPLWNPESIEKATQDWFKYLK